MARFSRRLVGALRLSAATFEEIEHDRSAIRQAALVVLGASVATVIGASPTELDTGRLTATILFAFLGWGVAAAVIWIAGAWLLPGKNTEADYQELLRVVGFAQAPGLVMIVGAVPGVYGWLRQAVWIWTLVALVIAVRQSLDYDDTLKAVVVCVLAQLIIVAAFMVVGFLGFGAAMFGSAM